MIRDTSATDRVIQRKGISRRALAWIIGAVVLFVGSAALYPSASRWARAERSVDMDRLRVADVVRGDLERNISVQGRLVAAFHPTLFSPETGRVTLLVRAGDVVDESQQIASIESPEIRSLLQQEKAQLQSAEGDLEREKIEARKTTLANRQAVDLLDVQVAAAERARARAEESRQAGIINDVEYEKAQDDHRIRGLELVHARQTADLEEENLAFEIREREIQIERQRLIVDELIRKVGELAIRSPVAGLVSRLDVQEQDVVAAGQPVVTVVDLSAFEIEIQVPESYAQDILMGTEAVITYDGREYPGRVKSMSPEVEGSQVRGLVIFDGDTPAGLKQNQRVSTRLIMESKYQILKVARGPFLENGAGRQAYVFDGELAVLRPIEVGAVSISEVEILAGVEEGDRIIISDTTRFNGAETVLVRR